jgi:hypothetical protein
MGRPPLHPLQFTQAKCEGFPRYYGKAREHSSVSTKQKPSDQLIAPMAIIQLSSPTTIFQAVRSGSSSNMALIANCANFISRLSTNNRNPSWLKYHSVSSAHRRWSRIIDDGRAIEDLRWSRTTVAIQRCQRLAYARIMREPFRFLYVAFAWFSGPRKSGFW